MNSDTAQTSGSTHGSDRPTPLVAKGKEFNLHALAEHFKSLQVVLAVSGSVAFFVSVGLHVPIFSRWGINFIQIAGPSDVLMSGIWLIITLFVPLLITALIGFVIYGQATKYLHSDKRSSKRPGIVYSMIRHDLFSYVYAVVAVLAVTVIIFYYDEIAISFTYSPDRESAMNTATAFLYYVVILLALGIAAQGKILVSGNVTLPRLLALGSTVALVFVLVLVWGSGTINIQAAYGFQREPLVADFPPCGGPARALWLGGQFTVMECVDAQDRRSGIVVVRSGVDHLKLQPR